MKFAHFAIRFATLIAQNKSRDKMKLSRLNDGTLVASSDEGFFEFSPSKLNSEKEIEFAIQEAWLAFEKAFKISLVPIDRLLHLLNNGEETNYKGLIHFSQDELVTELTNFSVENMGATIGMALMQVWGPNVLHMDLDLISQIRSEGLDKPLVILSEKGKHDKLMEGHENLRHIMAIKACHPKDFEKHFRNGIPVRFLEVGKDIVVDEDADVNIGINEEALQPA